MIFINGNNYFGPGTGFWGQKWNNTKNMGRFPGCRGTADPGKGCS